MGNVFDSGGDGVVSCEWRVHNDTEVFHLEVGLIQGFKKAPVVEVVVEWDSRMEVCDSRDEHRVFSWGREQTEAVAIDRDVDREDRGNFYSRWR